MPNPHPGSHLTDEIRAKGRATQMFTRRWYRDTLLKIFRGDIECSAVQFNALCKFADQRGWFPPNRPKTKAFNGKSVKPKPEVTQDMIDRLSAFNVSTFPNQSSNQNIANTGDFPNHVRHQQ